MGLATTLFVQSALAQDHLVPKYPEKSFVGQDYDRIVRSVLKDAFTHDVIVKARIWNPLGIDGFVGLKQNETTFTLFSLESTEGLFSYAEVDNAKHEGGSPKQIASWNEDLGPLRSRPEDVPINRCELHIESDLANKVASAWNKMIAGTRRDPPAPIGTSGIAETVTVDGTSYEFSNLQGEIGTAYAPDATGGAAKLIDIVDLIRQACEERTRKRLGELNAKLNSLLSK